MKPVKRYQFNDHKHDYEYCYSIEEYKMFVVANIDAIGECDDRNIVTQNDIIWNVCESQVTLECLLIEKLMTIDIKNESIEFVDIALGIIDALGKKDKDYV